MIAAIGCETAGGKLVTGRGCLAREKGQPMDSHPTTTGANLIAGRPRRAGDSTFEALRPRSGESGATRFHEATDEEIHEAAGAAEEAAGTLARWEPRQTAQLLRAVAEDVEALDHELLAVADEETALGVPRLTGERARTCAQLRLFADHVESGAHLEVIIAHADQQATPPSPDLRRMLVPLGPVAVFGASNFPLAFGVPGGDTASALAAGCPVIAKAHPSHPGTSELCGAAITRAVTRAGAPAGTFSLLQGHTPAVGETLVEAPEIQAVGFTGSHRVGRHLHTLGANRSRPIPVYAEMGSLNPVFVTEAALRARSTEIAEGLAASMTLGTGQFCTKPGLLLVPDSWAGQQFTATLAQRLDGVEPTPMLSAGIRDGYRSRLAETSALSGVEVAVEGPQADAVAPSLVVATWDAFLRHPALLEEHFGPVSVVVAVPEGEFVIAARHLEGSLTATLHCESDEAGDLEELQGELRSRAGRMVWNGYPTGVAVSHAQHHGGPYPATNAVLHTSVGTTAVRRFLRPISFQDAPEAALPRVLRDDNPLDIRRQVNGVYE